MSQHKSKGSQKKVGSTLPTARAMTRSQEAMTTKPEGNVLRALPESAEERKECPITTGVLDYFPLAIAEVARASKAGNDQHCPGQPLHWAREKSTDHADCLVRHLIERGTRDKDGQRHTAKVAWRALALLQEELEAEAGFGPKSSDADAKSSDASMNYQLRQRAIRLGLA